MKQLTLDQAWLLCLSKLPETWTPEDYVIFQLYQQENSIFFGTKDLKKRIEKILGKPLTTSILDKGEGLDKTRRKVLRKLNRFPPTSAMLRELIPPEDRIKIFQWPTTKASYHYNLKKNEKKTD